LDLVLSFSFFYSTFSKRISRGDFNFEERSGGAVYAKAGLLIPTVGDIGTEFLGLVILLEKLLIGLLGTIFSSFGELSIIFLSLVLCVCIL
jgi:hypothetical protein